jgi:hypothetical protein
VGKTGLSLEQRKFKKGSLMMLLHLLAALPCLIATERRKREENDCQRSVKKCSWPVGSSKEAAQRGCGNVAVVSGRATSGVWSYTGTMTLATTQTGRVLLPTVVLYARSFENRGRALGNLLLSSLETGDIANAHLLIPTTDTAANT